jgi:biotin carboxylase
MPRVLILAATTGYQTRLFGEAAARSGFEVLFATDRCTMLDDPWRDGAVAVRFYDEDGSLAALLDAVAGRKVDGVLAVGDRPTALAARAAAALGLPFHPPEAARAASNKLLTRRRLAAKGLPVPWYFTWPAETDPAAVLPQVSFPCVIKPLTLSASRGVIRADDAGTFVEAWRRLAELLRQPELRAQRDPASEVILVEGFVPGREYALEGVLDRGRLQVLALFDKPDPLEGPFFEETIYTTPSRLPAVEQARLVAAVRAAASALGLWHGPIHAECRVCGDEIVVLEVAARPIGGLCARALWFLAPEGTRVPLEELLLRHAAGESAASYRREPQASGVMMIPIPRAGFFRTVDGLDEARGVAGVTEIRLTAKPGQRLAPLPEGASYLGFIFARADTPAAVEAALRAAHARLRVVIDPALPVL